MISLDFNGMGQKKQIDSAYQQMITEQTNKQNLVLESAKNVVSDYEKISKDHIKPLMTALESFLKKHESFKSIDSLNEDVNVAKKIYAYLSIIKNTI